MTPKTELQYLIKIHASPLGRLVYKKDTVEIGPTGPHEAHAATKRALSYPQLFSKVEQFERHASAAIMADGEEFFEVGEWALISTHRHAARSI